MRKRRRAGHGHCPTLPARYVVIIVLNAMRAKNNVNIGSLSAALLWSSLLALALFAAAASSAAEASCRVGGLHCNSDRDCWSGGRNSSVPSNCKCCTGFPFPQGGECRQ